MNLPRTLGRVGVVTRQPLLWAGITAAMAASSPKARRAALRGSVCYGLSALVGNGLKPVFSRPQPRHWWTRKPEAARASFPSGHAAAEVAYTFGASLEMPSAMIPLGTLALLAHWSLLRAGKHYISDMLVGGTIGLVLVGITAKVWPPSSKHKPLPLP